MCENIDPTRWIAWWESTVLSRRKNLLTMDLVVVEKGHWRYFGQGGGQPLFGNIDDVNMLKRQSNKKVLVG